MKKRIIYSLTFLCFFSCSDDSVKGPTTASKTNSLPEDLFKSLSVGQSGIDFINRVESQEDFNVLTYRNYYNGGGVAIGDINNDGLPDLYFTANMAPNKLYLNEGGLTFKDISEQAGVSGTKSWSTGVSMVDINGDGLQDIYVCNSGGIDGSNKENELFINNGDLTFREAAAEFNLNDGGFSTHASFFDYDQDGDLDAYILNNSFKDPSRINFKNVRNERDQDGGDKLMRNDGGRFINVSEAAGIYGSKIGFGLGVSVSDLNNDNLPDIYISNDFWERDYLYLNQGDGTFKEDLPERIYMTSTASMGADIADVNNDNLPDIFSTDMLPATNKRVKKMTIFNEYSLENRKYREDYHYQFTQNCLQINQGDAYFDEYANHANVAATDWSWAALIFDFDNNGDKDIFVSNGVYHDITDIDFSEFIEDNNAVSQIIKEKGKFDFKDFLEYLPSVPLSNYAFVNKGNLGFENMSPSLGLDEASFSNGSAYGDLDNDGDLDLVVNNVNMPAFVYENKTDELLNHNYLGITFKGADKNTFGVGCRVRIKTENLEQVYQNYQVRGFQSSTVPELVIGLGEESIVSELEVIWPDGSMQRLLDIPANQKVQLDQNNAKSTYSKETLDLPLLKNVTDRVISGESSHRENDYNDFDYERLMTHMVSTTGPELVIGDVNGDGKNDFIIQGAAGDPDKLFMYKNGRYIFSEQAYFSRDAIFEGVAGTMIDLDNDGDSDYIVGTGGNMGDKNFQYYSSRTYLNDGDGNFSRQILPGMSAFGNTSTITPLSNVDGVVYGLFIGNQVVPGNYGLAPRNYLMVNAGNQWKDITAQAIGQLGMVTCSAAGDLDNDGDDDLVVAGEFMAIHIFENDGSGLVLKEKIPNTEGMWQSLKIMDIDGDKKVDIVAGNWGTNVKLKASPEKPLTMFINDFDRNKKSEFIHSWYGPEDTEEGIFASKRNLTAQLPGLRKKFLRNRDFAVAKVEDLYSQEILQESQVRKVVKMESMILYNDGDFNFTMKDLPVEAQLAPIYGMATLDVNGDKVNDLIIGGNLFEVIPDVGRLEGSRGLVLLGQEGRQFHPLSHLESGLNIRGQIRDIKVLENGDKPQILFAINNQPIRVYEPTN